jgi:cysteine desulfurase
MTTQKRIYLDNNATTAVEPRIIESIADYLSNSYGNPSSVHAFGQEARQRLHHARQIVASYLGVSPQEIVFTSGGTEAINMVIQGLFSEGKSGHIITSEGEHASLHHTVGQMEKRGCRVSYLPIGSWGAVKPEEVAAAICPDTKLIALIAANNETGVRTDIDAIAQIAYEVGIPFVVDAVALLGKEQFTPIHKGISAICFSGHKIHAPKGIGMAFVRNQLRLSPLLCGGEQEYKRRAGTENMSGIIAFAEAIRAIQQHGQESIEKMRMLRDRLETGIRAHIPDIKINGEGPRISNTSNIAFPNIDGESLLILLDQEGIAASHGSACASGALEPSRILLKMGVPLALARASIRFSLSRFTTEEEIERTVKTVVKLVSTM